MSFVQALKRLITTNESVAASGTTTTDSNAAVPDATNSTNNHSSTHSTASTLSVSTSKSNDNFKPLSQGLQKKYARGVQYNST